MGAAGWVCGGGSDGWRWRRRKGVKTVSSRVVTDLMVCIPDCAVRTASPCSVDKVNATVDGLAGEYGWICFGSETVRVDVA